MKAKLFFLTLALALSVTLQPSPSGAASQSQIIQQSCLSFCAVVRCFPENVCGPYVNSSGQTVCGCHPRA
jgi:hypothetical protein